MAGGNQLSFPTFKVNVDKQPDPMKTVMECALFLRESKEIDSALWRKFSRRFFQYYRTTILGYYGYENEEDYVSKIKLNYPDFFITVMFEMQKMDVFDCNTTQLADTLHSAFGFTQKRSTIRNLYYKRVSEYDEVLTFFRAFKKAGKLKK